MNILRATIKKPVGIGKGGQKVRLEPAMGLRLALAGSFLVVVETEASAPGQKPRAVVIPENMLEELVVSPEDALATIQAVAGEKGGSRGR